MSLSIHLTYSHGILLCSRLAPGLQPPSSGTGTASGGWAWHPKHRSPAKRLEALNISRPDEVSGLKAARWCVGAAAAVSWCKMCSQGPVVQKGQLHLGIDLDSANRCSSYVQDRCKLSQPIRNCLVLFGSRTHTVAIIAETILLSTSKIMSVVFASKRVYLAISRCQDTRKRK